MTKEMLAKYSKPSRFDSAPQGTVIKSFNDTGINESGYDYFVQISSYDEIPNWVPWGYLLGLVFKEKALDQDFVNKCIDAFEYPNKKKPELVKK